MWIDFRFLKKMKLRIKEEDMLKNILISLVLVNHFFISYYILTDDLHHQITSPHLTIISFLSLAMVVLILKYFKIDESQ